MPGHIHRWRRPKWGHNVESSRVLRDGGNCPVSCGTRTAFHCCARTGLFASEAERHAFEPLRVQRWFVRRLLFYGELPDRRLNGTDLYKFLSSARLRYLPCHFYAGWA